MSAEPDAFLGGRLRLRQPPRGAHRAGTDAVLLARLLAPAPGDTLYDLGASTGAVGLAAARMSGACRVVLVERDPDLAALARENASSNGLAERVAVIEADVLAPGAQRRAAGLEAGCADIVLTNPPFFEAGGHRPSPVPQKASAHAFAAGGLDLWLRTCADLLRPGGRLGLIHRADALPTCLDALRGRFGDCAVRPVHARSDRPAIRVLIAAVKGSRAPCQLLPPLVLQDEAGRFTPEAEALHRGAPWPAA
ncbi:tRNA1(Val) (adenine(37)-N6)-methyltransferase [Methylorubrum thiocyanatum]|uniref:tRNA1(Val) A37 N6-methylase TrmN6 n=1 Tax=Methylorubrum thiocyanatum TaxID=47958 RepID=A0AA40S1Z4_9HYPH|nr:methyltransferase [Methylorubrum thiocyanatum]MBA8912928.1 tRNA1(Val) A37 N6-methylase TrmN6 [Methylorubrum thiocyanatum]GJE83587.1 tRNA1(Val) (adenine(37)-N6)-methyltransferase [Methylorubrum thiocyanatum]